MKSAQNKMNNSSCGTDNDGRVTFRTGDSTVDSTRNQGDLKEIGNHGDLRDVTDTSGNRDKNNMTSSR